MPWVVSGRLVRYGWIQARDQLDLIQFLLLLLLIAQYTTNESEPQMWRTCKLDGSVPWVEVPQREVTIECWQDRRRKKARNFVDENEHELQIASFWPNLQDIEIHYLAFLYRKFM